MIIAGRAIAAARDVDEPINRREDGDAPDPRGDEDDSGKSHRNRCSWKISVDVVTLAVRSRLYATFTFQ